MRSKRYCQVVNVLILSLVVLLLWMPTTTAGDDFTPVYNPTLEVSRAAGAIKIDGDLDDAGWRGAVRANNFAEHSPGDQTKPPVATEAFITYDDDYLYVSFVCYDDPNVIRASFCDRERLQADDNICLLIDTYGDAAWAYELNVNPYGIQADAIWSRNYGEDGSYDLVWESAGRITDNGYQIEMAVPFSSLRFPNKNKQTWKVDFWRNHPRDSRRQYSWAAYDRDDPCWPCQWGTVTGIENVQPGKGIEILPTVIGYQSGARDGDGNFDNDNPDGQISLGAKYAITSNITAEATYNPDFSQVEADAAQVDVNTTFALSYPERRPFFQEGSDLFRTWVPIVYTRSINDPDFAGKLTLRANRTSVAYLVARDENTPIILPFEESGVCLPAGKSTSNVIRARQGLGEDTHIGLLLTDRRIDGGGSGTLLSVDGELKLSKHFRLQYQAIGNHTEEPVDETLNADISELIDDGQIDSTFDGGLHTAALDGESYTGHMYMVNLEQQARHLEFDISYTERSPTYRADNGFEPRNNQRLTQLSAGYTFYSESDLLEWVTPQFDLGSAWNFDGKKKDEWLFANLSIRLKTAQTYIHTQYMRSAENFGGVQFDDIWGTHICFQVRPGELLAFGGAVNYGHRIARRKLAMGMETTLFGWADLKPIDRLLIENWFDYTKSDELNSGQEIFEGYIARTRLNYQFTRELSLRLVVQYDDFYETWDIDPLITFRLSPFSVFYLGSTFGYDTFEEMEPDGIRRSTRLASRQFYMKLQYLFQI